MVGLTEQLGERLLAQGFTIGTAESCTGGLIASRLTDVPGSSVYFMGGIVAYSNALKQNLLDVPGKLLIDHGAVSEAVAGAMADGARRALGVDFALSVTGIAGPGGGTDDKPVGLTFVGFAGPGGLRVVERHIWPHDRAGNKEASAAAALNLALRQIQAMTL
jgi:PncC family amidohydrolase